MYLFCQFLTSIPKSELKVISFDFVVMKIPKSVIKVIPIDFVITKVKNLFILVNIDQVIAQVVDTTDHYNSFFQLTYFFFVFLNLLFIFPIDTTRN